MEFNLETIAILAVLAGQIVAVVVAIRRPNEKQDVKVAMLSTKIESLSAQILANSDALKLMRANHLPHIEVELKGLAERTARIETILDERLPQRNAKQ